MSRNAMVRNCHHKKRHQYFKRVCPSLGRFSQVLDILDVFYVDIIYDGISHDSVYYNDIDDNGVFLRWRSDFPLPHFFSRQILI